MPVFEDEREFEDVLMDNSEILSEEFGGDSFIRQVNMFGYGVADIVGFSTEKIRDERVLTVTIYELKKGKVDFNAVGQVCRYVKAARRFLEKTKPPEKLKKTRVRVVGVVIGSRIASGDVCYVCDFLDDISAYSYEISAICGLSLKHELGWHQTSEDFLNINRSAVVAVMRSLNNEH